MRTYWHGESNKPSPPTVREALKGWPCCAHDGRLTWDMFAGGVIVEKRESEGRIYGWSLRFPPDVYKAIVHLYHHLHGGKANFKSIVIIDPSGKIVGTKVVLTSSLLGEFDGDGDALPIQGKKSDTPLARGYGMAIKNTCKSAGFGITGVHPDAFKLSPVTLKATETEKETTPVVEPGEEDQVPETAEDDVAASNDQAEVYEDSGDPVAREEQKESGQTQAESKPPRVDTGSPLFQSKKTFLELVEAHGQKIDTKDEALVAMVGDLWGQCVKTLVESWQDSDEEVEWPGPDGVPNDVMSKVVAEFRTATAHKKKGKMHPIAMVVGAALLKHKKKQEAEAETKKGGNAKAKAKKKAADD